MQMVQIQNRNHIPKFSSNKMTGDPSTTTLQSIKNKQFDFDLKTIF